MEKQNQNNFFSSVAGRIVITLLCMVIIYGAILLCLATDNPILIIPIGLALLVFGWKKLGDTNPFLLIFASENFLVFYYIVKFMLSLLIGYFVAPF